MTDKVKELLLKDLFTETVYDYKGNVQETLKEIAEDVAMYRELEINFDNYNVSELVEFIGQQMAYIMYSKKE